MRSWRPQQAFPPPRRPLRSFFFEPMILSRELIDADADKVVRRLARQGHQAYLVGGCVRDLLLDRTPKDFDVATSATPNEIKQSFRNCRIIGRRFRLAHIFFGGKIIETSTFRANPRRPDADDNDDELLIRHDNVFGTPTQDAQRRDFTINGLFYDVQTERVIDHVGGLDDLKARVIRTIGDPDIRFREDPVRMLRAVKFAARLDFEIEPRTYEALRRHRGELVKCAPARLLEEFYRLLRGRAAQRSMRLLLRTGLAAILSPQLETLYGSSDTTLLGSNNRDSDASEQLDEAAWLATWDDAPPASLREGAGDATIFDNAEVFSNRRGLAWRVLHELDKTKHEPTNALLVASVLNAFVYEELLQPGVRAVDAATLVTHFLRPLISQIRIARRDAERARQILLAQRRLAPSRRRRGKPMALVRRDYFDEALILYQLTAQAAGRDANEVQRWHELKTRGAPGGSDAPNASVPSRKRRRRRRGGRRRRGASERAPDPANLASDEPIE